VPKSSALTAGAKCVLPTQSRYLKYVCANTRFGRLTGLIKTLWQIRYQGLTVAYATRWRVLLSERLAIRVNASIDSIEISLSIAFNLVRVVGLLPEQILSCLLVGARYDPDSYAKLLRISSWCHSHHICQ
jgi:hypothetical protein